MEKYKYRAWKNIAKALTSDKEVKDYFVKLPLVGKTIKNIRILGHDYRRNDYDLVCIWNEYCREHNIPTGFADFDDALSKINSSIIPDTLLDQRIVQLDEPIILEFTDGSQIEMDADEVANEISVTFNEIPADAKADINRNNIDGNIIFSTCLGKTITAINFISEVPNEYDEDIIPSIFFSLNDGTDLHIGGWADFCEVWVTSSDDKEKILPISWGELKKGIHDL